VTYCAEKEGCGGEEEKDSGWESRMETLLLGAPNKESRCYGNGITVASQTWGSGWERGSKCNRHNIHRVGIDVMPLTCFETETAMSRRMWEVGMCDFRNLLDRKDRSKLVG
jgi:hypothetical protein